MGQRELEHFIFEENQELDLHLYSMEEANKEDFDLELFPLH